MKTVVVLSACLLVRVAAAQTPDVVSFDGNGTLTWTNADTGLYYRVEWAPCLTDSNAWRSDYRSLTDIRSTGDTVSVKVPMFYRVVGVARPPANAAVITVDADTDIGHPFVGWSASAQIAHQPWTAAYSEFADYGPMVLDALVNELGITDIRLQGSAGIENDADYYRQAEDAADERIWSQNNWAGRDTGVYYMSSIDAAVSRVVNPMRARITARGETPHVVLHFNGGGNGGNLDFYDGTADRQKIPETILAIHQHLWTAYGWIPDAVEPINEPNMAAAWTTGEYADIVYRVGTTLEVNKGTFGQGAGWRPTINGASISTVSSKPAWFDAVWDYDPDEDGSYPNRRWLAAIAWHPYDSGRPNWYFGALNTRLANTGLASWMSEYTGLTAALVHKILVAVPETVRFQRFAAAYTDGQDDTHNGSLFVIGRGINLPLGSVHWAEATKLLRNYMKYVRPRAQRKGVTHTAAATFCNGIPWLNPNGKLVVVVNTTGPGVFWLDCLPAGTYGINYGLGTDTDQALTTNSSDVSAWNQDLADSFVSAGSALKLISDGAGVYTVYQK